MSLNQQEKKTPLALYNYGSDLIIEEYLDTKLTFIILRIKAAGDYP